MTAQLKESDRRFFTLVSEAAFANPFGARRSDLDAEISEAAHDDPDWLLRMLERVGARLSALSPQRPLDVGQFAGRDRELVEHSVLFEVFHRYVNQLDRLIESQARAGQEPLRVELAPAFLQRLVSHGFQHDAAVRFFELFYQMRRGYYFISHGLGGKSDCMRALREELWCAVFTHDIRRYERDLWDRMEDFSTILLGETGTGKGAAAAAIGRSGFIAFDPKKQCFTHGPGDGFVPIHLNEFPETLFESEIFGHRKGAFTGAVEHHEGVLARCPAHGTVFFDEIGEATLPVQVKLLRVLQNRSYSPVGSREPRRFSGRIVAATHRSLSQLRQNGALRDDFFYRLCSNVIHVPALRTRIMQAPSELPELVQHICARIRGSSDGASTTASSALAEQVAHAVQRDLGRNYAFPGNVRELEQCVRRVLMTGSCAPDERATPDGNDFSARVESGTLSAERLLELYCAMLYARTPSYVEVARITGLDRRTVKKHVEHAATRS